MSEELLLAGIVESLSKAIEEQPDHDKRHKLKDARELVRDVLWETDVAAQTHRTGQGEAERNAGE